MDRIRRDTLLGFVFFGSLAFLLWATLNLTDQAYGNAKLLVRFAQAGSCEVGTNVMVLGKKIGKVGAIDVDYADGALPIAMTLLLREEIPLRQDYAIAVKDNGVLGGKQVYIDPGRAPARLAADAALRGEVEPGAFDQIGNIAKGEGKLGGKAVDAIEEFRKFFANMNDPTTSVGKLVNSSTLYDQLSDAAESLGEALKAVTDQKGAIGDLVMNAETRDNLHGFLASLNSLGRKLDTGRDGVLGVLLNDPNAARDVQSILDNLEILVAGARQGDGLVGRLLRDDELARRFVNLVGNLDKLLGNLTDPEAGALGALTSDPATARDIKTTLANLRTVSEQLASKQGLLGAMINDPDLATRFRRILTQVSRAIEDAREAAPIGSFIQVLIGYW